MAVLVSASAQDLSIRQLQYVVAVADTLGFHRAATQCRVSQPTLSSQVQKVEEVLGVRIFERDRRRVLVTPPGEAVIAHARKVLIAVDDLLAIATASADPFTGTLNVGVIPTIAPYLLPWLTPTIAKRWPRLRLALIEQKTDDLLTALRAGTLDAGLLALVDGMEDLAHVTVLEDPFVAAFPQAHPLTMKKTVTLADLEDEPVLLLEDGHCLRTQALALCKRAGASETAFRATSLATLVQMVSAGVGMTLLPSIAIDVENRRGQLAIRPLAATSGGRSPRPAARSLLFRAHGSLPRPAARTICLAWRKAAPRGKTIREIGTAMEVASRDVTKMTTATLKKIAK